MSRLDGLNDHHAPPPDRSEPCPHVDPRLMVRPCARGILASHPEQAHRAQSVHSYPLAPDRMRRPLNRCGIPVLRSTATSVAWATVTGAPVHLSFGWSESASALLRQVVGHLALHRGSRRVEQWGTCGPQADQSCIHRKMMKLNWILDSARGGVVCTTIDTFLDQQQRRGVNLLPPLEASASPPREAASCRCRQPRPSPARPTLRQCHCPTRGRFRLSLPGTVAATAGFVLLVRDGMNLPP